MKLSLALLFVLFFPLSLFSQVDTAWVRHYNGQAKFVALDNIGNIYVTGESFGDFFTIKYNSDGDSLWGARFDGGNTEDIPYGLFVDNVGFVYVTGWAFIPSQVYDFITIKYNAATGDTVWTARYPKMGVGNNGKFTKILFVDSVSTL